MSLREYGVQGSIIGLPGHTPGSVGILLAGGHLLAGDTFMNFAGPHLAHVAEDFATMHGAKFIK